MKLIRFCWALSKITQITRPLSATELDNILMALRVPNVAGFSDKLRAVSIFVTDINWNYLLLPMEIRLNQYIRGIYMWGTFVILTGFTLSHVDDKQCLMAHCVVSWRVKRPLMYWDTVARGLVSRIHF